MTFPLFVAAGEALTDMVVQDAAQQHWSSLTGGSTWNVARTMARLDVPTAFAGAISKDVFGDALWKASEAARLESGHFTGRARASGASCEENAQAPFRCCYHRRKQPIWRPR